MARRGTAAWATLHWGKACQPALLASVQLAPGVPVPCPPALVPAWQAFAGVLAAYQYPVRRADTGAYNCRNKTGTTTPSLHSWPLATDLNWQTNPYLRTPTLRTIRWCIETDMPAAMVQELEAIKTGAGLQVFHWGGRWRSVKDAMHWEALVTPAELAAGIVSPRQLLVEDEMTLKRGDSGPAVGVFQEALLVWAPGRALPEHGADDDFGGEMEKWVRLYQRAARIPDTGQVDGVTAALLARYLPPAAAAEAGRHVHQVTLTGTTQEAGE